MEFQEKMGSLYFVSNDGSPLYEVTHPAILFCKDTYTLHKIGNVETVDAYYQKCIKKCQLANSLLYEDWVMMDIPKEAELMNKLHQISGYTKVFLKENNISLS